MSVAVCYVVAVVSVSCCVLCGGGVSGQLLCVM